MNAHDPDHCSEFFNETAHRLMPLYGDSSEDVPENVLSEYPDPGEVESALKMMIDLLLPGRIDPGTIGLDDFSVFLLRRLSHTWRHLRPQIERSIPFRWYGRAALTEGMHVSQKDVHEESNRVLKAFFEKLPDIRRMVIQDIQAAYDGDPAALTYAEVQLAYPGLLAISAHRLAHELYALDVPVVPRIMSEWTHSQTGVDMHPGAKVGHSFFIDHATGVVVGETTEIGNRVKIYQGVTLGAKSFPLDENGLPIKHVKRHPTVEDDVIIYSNSTILGGDTVIGCGSTIGANVFLYESIPPNSLVSAMHPELKIKPQRGKGGCKEKQN
ncbi:MAG: serine acetyltransferase [Kiritimatiellae bacterium]|jgi:serine O-acetyltransferase|nr:serine acetyltransferase [Kiritimatiellia bacterium]